MVTKEIVLKDEVLILTNKRAIYWKRLKTLILSDMHIGKTAHFRRHGIPISDDVLKNDLNRLESLIGFYKPEQLVIVGDLFHAEANTNMEYFFEWRQGFSFIDFVLIKGNHDRLSDYWMSKLKLIVKNQHALGPFLFVHDPDETAKNQYLISGHIHPGVSIKGRGRQRIKLPCYTVTERQLILPAFSEFTGLNSRFIDKKANFYAFTSNEFFEF